MRRYSFTTVVAALSAVFFAAGFAHAQDTLRGLGPVNGYTGERFDTTAHAYDYLVDSSLKQDDPAQKRFRTVEAAYAAAPAGTPGRPTVIGIKPDVYHLPGQGLTTGLVITKNWITLLGLTDDRRKVVLADNRGNQEGAGVLGASNNGYAMIVRADGFSAINLTIVNYCNLDYDYPGDPQKDLKKRSSVITQAVALDAQGDRHVYSHVALLGRLDTTFIRTTRSYFTHVFIEGTDDFIGGGTVGVWEDSEVYFPTGNGVMSASGITFIHTVFKAARGLEFYKGTRNPVTLIDCVLPVNSPANPVAWMVWKAPPRENLLSTTYRTRDASGKPARILDSIVGPPRYTLSRELSPSEVKAFNPWNLLHAKPGGGDDGWDPAGVRTQYESAGAPVFRMNIVAKSLAEQVSGASDSTAMSSPFATPTPGNVSIRTGGPGAKISATVLPAEASADAVRWSSPSSLISFNNPTGASTIVTGHNTGARAEWVEVHATAPDGFYVTSYVYVEPAYIAPPVFTAGPRIEAPSAGKVTVAYGLALSGHDDQSRITWSLCQDESCQQPRMVAVSRGDEPLKTLVLTPGMIGKYIQVSIEPKHNISDPGPAVTAVSARPIAAADVPSRSVRPDFRNFVITENATYENGEWTLLGRWTSVSGDNLVHGYGIRVGSAGASLLYQGAGPAGDMQVKVVMTPEKTAGQGFGVPGSSSEDPKVQRADLFIKYDPRTKNGYSLRFWRTTQAADKCMFQLFRIVNGRGEPLNDQQQLTGVFKPNTTIVLSVVGTKFTATGSNSVDDEKLHLSGEIEPNSYGGAGAYWSGSVPLGNSVVFSAFDITY